MPGTTTRNGLKYLQIFVAFAELADIQHFTFFIDQVGGLYLRIAAGENSQCRGHFRCPARERAIRLLHDLLRLAKDEQMPTSMTSSWTLLSWMP